MAVEIGALRALLSLDSAAFESGVKRAQGSTKRLSDTMKQVGKVAAKAFAAVTAAAIAGARDIDQVAKASRRIGSSIGGFEALKLAAGEAGVPLSSLPDELQNINREIANIGTSGNADRALERLGLAASDLANLDADEKIARIADRVRELGLSSGEATALLRDLGVRNREMVLLLQQGGGAIRAARVDVEDYGLALSGPAAAAIEGANDQIGRLSLIARVFGQHMALAVVPALGRFAEKMTESLREGGALRTMINILADIGRVFANVLDLVSENLDFLIDLFKVFVAAKIVTFVAASSRAFVVFARAIRSTGLVMVVFTSITRAKITAIALLGAVIAKVTGTYDTLVGFIRDTSQALLNALPPEIQSGISDLGDKIMGLGESIGETARVAENDLFNALNDAEGAAGSFGEASRGASKGVEALSEKTGESARKIADNSREMATAISEPLKDALKGGELNAQTFSDAMMGIFERLRDRLIDQIFKPIEDAISDAFSGSRGGGSGGGILSGITSGIAGLFGPGQTTGKGLTVNTPNLLPPMFDSGGFIRAGQLGIVGERGPEIVTGPANVTSRVDTAKMLGGQVVNNITVQAPPGSDVQEQRRQNSTGGEDLTIIIDRAVSNLARDPGSALSRTLGQNFGLRPATRGR